MTLAYIPESVKEMADILIELDRRLTNAEGKVGSGLSHNDLKDTEDHKAFLKNDGSVPVVGNLDFSKAGRIKNSANRILNVDIFRGAVRLNSNLNQLEFDLSSINSDDVAEGEINLYYTQERQDDIEAFAFMMGNG